MSKNYYEFYDRLLILWKIINPGKISELNQVQL